MDMHALGMPSFVGFPLYMSYFVYKIKEELKRKHSHGVPKVRQRVLG